MKNGDCFINILLINTRSPASLERRLKFADAVMLNDYNLVCACETRLNDNILSSELLLDNYNIYRSDRKQDAENNTHGREMIAIKNSLASEQLFTDQPDCSLTCRLEIIKLSFLFLCSTTPRKEVGTDTHKRTLELSYQKQHSINLWRS